MRLVGHPRRGPHRKLIVSAFGAAFAGMVALGGCTLVGDSLTGVDLSVQTPTTCVKECNDSYKVLYDEEQKRHLENVEACKAFEEPERASCLEAEGVRHSAAMDALGEAKTDCQNTCHRQGSVNAG